MISKFWKQKLAKIFKLNLFNVAFGKPGKTIQINQKISNLQQVS